jgi:aldose 1-epimerase
MKPVLLAAAALAAMLTGCASMHDTTAASVSSRWFGVAKNGRPATLWTLRMRGLEIDVSDYGATLVAVRTPDRAGFLGDVVLGFDDVRGYESPANQYFGCTTGRVCNRIANGRFTLDGYTYQLATNNGPHHLHGGATRSFDKVFWQGEVVAGEGGAQGVRFRYRSKDGEEGYPGDLDVEVTYWLLPGPAMKVITRATTDRRTPVNVTNHAYWNLAGAGAPTVLEHVLRIDADRYTPTDDTLIPTGAIASARNGPLDFTKPLALGVRLPELIDSPAKGFDHNYVLRGDGMREVAELRDPSSGRWLKIATTEPGLQLYSGNFLHGQIGKGGRAYAQRSAVCLETQHFPDSVNQLAFPSTILEPGQQYETTTEWRFGAE